LYDSDSYCDDLPYWNFDHCGGGGGEKKQPHLVIPYTLSENDMKFVSNNGFTTGGEFAQYLKDTLDYLIKEGERGKPKMMTVGLHCRVIGRPGRCAGLEEFLEYANSKREKIWFARRDEIAKHWYANHYPDDTRSKL
jgi:allantoinase